MKKRRKIIIEEEEKPKLKKKKKTKMSRYQNGGEGFIAWIEDFEVAIEVFENGFPVFRPLVHMSDIPNPETGRSSAEMWEEMKIIARECLAMGENGKFLYRLIIFCWMRGEGKSAFVCLIQLWKFFCFPSQKIMLGANSKDQSKFVHYDIMRDIILNSPKLLIIIGEKNIQEKQISLLNKKKKVVSFIRSISSFSGIVSNISGYTFSEIFDMVKPKFFTQLDGSIRNIPNALGCIDSTVSKKDHILYRLYEIWKKGSDPTVYFSHRESPNADYRDYWNPEMTKAQLNSYKEKFPEGEFNQYFKNTWDSAAVKFFAPEVIQATLYAGFNNVLGEQSKVLQVLKNCENLEKNKNIPDDQKQALITDMKSHLIPVRKLYKLQTEYFQPRSMNLDELKRLSDMYNTNWIIQAGADRADPEKADITRGARTMVGAVAKGLPGSRDTHIVHDYDSESTKFIYFPVHVVHIIHSDLNSIKDFLETMNDAFNGIDSFCTERWGMWDMGEWCESRNIHFEAISPTYDRQKEAFSEMYTIWTQGRFKCPELAIKGSKRDNILLEEAENFDHDKARKFYGSNDKKSYNGIQDDCMYMFGWSIYGGRMLTSAHMRERSKNEVFGMFTPNKELIGDY